MIDALRSGAGRVIETEAVSALVAALCVTACCELPSDVVAALTAAWEREAPDSPARATLAQLLENERLARQARRPICQDTGLTVVFAELGREARMGGDLYEAIDAGVRRAYTDAFLRKSVLSAVGRVNTRDNTPATVHLRLVEGDALRLTVAPKGFGSENMSRVVMLTPADGMDGVLREIVETVTRAGACACPPGVVGVGIGGTLESCALLAKRQLLRPVGEPGEASVRALEASALAAINDTGIGPMGLGGRTTALAVHIAEQPTHIAGLPVAVNLQCHACRHATGVI